MSPNAKRKTEAPTLQRSARRKYSESADAPGRLKTPPRTVFPSSADDAGAAGRLHSSSALRAADDNDGDRRRRKSEANPEATRRSPNGFHTGWRKVRYAPRSRALDALLLSFFFLLLRRTWMRNSGANKDPIPRTNGFASLRARESPYLGSPDPISLLSSASLVFLLF